MNNTFTRPCDPDVIPRPTTVPTSDPGPWAECSPLAHSSDWTGVPVPTSSDPATTTTAPAPEATVDTAVITGPVTPFSAVETTAYTYDIGTPPTIPPALPQTGVSGGILLAATLAILAGIGARRAARRRPS